MNIPSTIRDRLIWGAAISLIIMLSSPPLVRSAAASRCCYYDRSQILFTPTQEVSDDYVLTLSAIDPGYLFFRVLVPVIYASLILRIIWLIQRK